MKYLNFILLFILAAPKFLEAQQIQLSNEKSSLIIEGISTLHDWHINAEQLQGEATLTSSDQAKKIEKLNFKVLVKGLKSGKSAMDNNTYDALNNDDYKWITYQLNSPIELKKGINKETSSKGKLTIAGTTKVITIPVTITYQNTKMECKGKVTFNMTDFNIEPPTALLGTVKTGDEITINFNVIFN